MAAPAEVAVPVTVALLGRADSAREMLRHSLEDLGARVVFEGDPAGLAAEQVMRARPRVVIVNLASGVEDDIDHLQDVFDDPQVNVVFNEADVTSQLAGWDLARWARHLASKVTGREATIPPPPPGAQPLPTRNLMPVPGAPPTPAQLAPERPIEEFMIEAEDLVDQVPTDHLPVATARLRPEPEAPPAADLALDLDALEGALDEGDIAPQVQARAVPEPESESIVVLEDDAAEFDAGLDLGALDAALELDRAPRPAASRSDEELLRDALSGVALDLSPVAAAAAPAAVSRPAAPSLESLMGLSLDDDFGDSPVVPAASPHQMLSHDESAAPARTSSALDADHPSLRFESAETPRGARSTDFDDAAESSAESITLSVDADDVDSDLSISMDGMEDIETVALDVDYVEPGSDDSGVSTGSTGFIEFDAGDLGGGGDLLDDDVAALAAQLDALEASAPGKEALVDLDFRTHDDEADEPPVPAPAAKPEKAPAAAGSAPKPTASFSLESLSLAPLEEDPLPAQTAAPKPSFDFSGLNLSLEPTEEESAEQARQQAAASAVRSEPAPTRTEALRSETPRSDAPQRRDSDFDDLLAAMDLAPVSAPSRAVQGIPHVIVLGASIGGPDALRTFLGGIPEHFPALFVLVQHLENGFFERLAQQLQRASKLPVRVPAANLQAVAGEVLVVPAGARFSVDAEGTVGLEPHTEPARYTPCIDDVLRDVADRFGGAATAIIFSGMAGDAIEGAVHLAMQGGEVWAQDPASCVVSSMVDGARARGVVDFIGTPRELAERCVQKFGRR